MVETEAQIRAIRRFSRFYSARIGMLEEGLLSSPFGLTEARVLYELAHREAPRAAVLARELGLDPGYLSRILKRFAARSLVRCGPSAADRRQSDLRLTEAGRAAFAPLDEGSRAQVALMLAPLGPGERERLIEALATVERLLRAASPAEPPALLRPPRPGDMGWVVERHGALYALEHGFDTRFEALVAEIVAAFLKGCDPERERCWIAERDGNRLGSAFLVRHDVTTAKLRLLLVEPEARGQRLGDRLITECEGFARQAGHRRITLWTNDVLTAARRLYEKRGYRLVTREPHAMFGPAMIGETWELDLDRAAV